MQAELRTRCEHAVRLVRAFADEIVDQNRSVALGAIENECWLAFELKRGVDARHNALACRFLVARSTVDLSRQEQALDLLGLKRALKLGRIDGVVFDRVSRPQHLRGIESWNRLDHRELHVHGHGCRHAVHVNLVCV